jgi:hypothetical protein
LRWFSNPQSKPEKVASYFLTLPYLGRQKINPYFFDAPPISTLF